MPGIEDLYREIILDHYRNPRNRGELPAPPARRFEGVNPTCGDEVVVFVDLDAEGRVADVKVTGQGCSISQSSASMMSAAVKGRPLSEVRTLIQSFKAMVSADEQPEGVTVVPLGDLEALKGVVKFPVRIKCATLSWNTLAQGLDEADEPIAH